MLRRLIFAAALALCAVSAQAVCTLTTFRAFPDGGSQPSFIPLPPTGCVNKVDLAANVAKTDSIPTGANRVLIGSNCSEVHVKLGATVPAVAGDITDGTSGMVNVTQWHVTGATQITVISPAACRVTFAYYL